jgi:tetratricopeptide (TPR) repeat protein
MLALTKEGHLERARALVDVAAGERVRALAVYHHVRANLLDQLGRPEHARAAYERALELDPDYGPAATNLGILLGRLGDPAAGIAVLGRLIAAHPLASSALRNRAILRRTLGDVEGTVADLERALAIQPDATVAQALSDLYGQLGERERSAELAAESLRLDPRR